MIPYRLDIPEAELLDLRDRLQRTRWPEAETVDDWSQGVPLAYLRELCEYWATGYDWRRVEARLNALPQFKTDIDGLGIHFLHVRSPHPDAVPLVLTSGWPGSIVEFLKVIEPLTDPPDPADAFHVVCPSIPGFGFSDKPAAPGWGIERIAGAWLRLMTELGYERFGAQGSDWGTSITTVMAQQAPERLIGIHLMPPLAAPDPATFDDLTEAERQSIEALKHAAEWEDGYSAEQSTKPQTIGYSLVDSPVGLCAWIVEKFRAWTDSGGNPENVLTRDEILDSVMFYWLPGTGASSARLYWESIRKVQAWFTEATADVVEVPTGCTLFPKETPRPSRRWAAKRYPNIVHWHEPDRGGHFAAFEQPALFVEEVRTFFRKLDN
ncbi:epoxide hydrolase family protein [Amycolatopsis sp. 195334CR]|uniref:epoxide hydrolase family protein n=1 Tax=Amycolatopsis sp. 195334CR TaxID=2814588 RepID=UPI001A8CC4C9|nr:epoxide hydrolase family protein [Amycolatopsis sp. 195334CR]MBN6034753.1 epoxide hydrolase [Amycolatopsis sp. 195334CR]